MQKKQQTTVAPSPPGSGDHGCSETDSGGLKLIPSFSETDV